MKSISLTLTLSLTIVAFILGLMGGYYITPTYQQNMYVKEEMDLGAADRFVDLRYLNAMATHHQGAIELARQVSGKSSRSEINNLAADILKNEPKLIAQLQQWKTKWYKNDKPAPQPTVANLGTPDNKIDLRFLNALIAHHEEGIRMTREIRTKSSRAEVLNDADAVENFLSGSLVTLKNLRQSWYNVN